MNVLAVIMADNKDSDLGILSQNRSEAAVPFAGKYRVIDFALSNCVNSGICDIGIFTQYQPHSLNEHIRTGRPWDLERRLSGGVTLLPPYQRNGHSLDWYRGTADAIYQNLDFILSHGADTVLALSGDSVYKMDYNPLLQYHKQQRADVTICTAVTPPGAPFPRNTFITDGDGRVLEFQAQPCDSPNARSFTMGLCVFQADVLMQRLAQDTRSFNSSHDLGRDVLPRMLELEDRVYAYDFQDYAVNVGTVRAYWQANMDLLLSDPPLDLQDRHWQIHTRNDGRPPVSIYPDASVSNSLISDGCVIEGQVESSVLSPGVYVWAGAVVRDSVVLSDCEIKPGASVDRAILDKNVVVGQDAYVGADLDGTLHLGYSHALYPGITLVGKNTHIPAGLRIGRDCVVRGDPTKDDFVIHNQRIELPPAQAWTMPSDGKDLQATAVLESAGRRNN